MQGSTPATPFLWSGLRGGHYTPQDTIPAHDTNPTEKCQGTPGCDRTSLGTGSFLLHSRIVPSHKTVGPGEMKREKEGGRRGRARGGKREEGKRDGKFDTLPLYKSSKQKHGVHRGLNSLLCHSSKPIAVLLQKVCMCHGGIMFVGLQQKASSDFLFFVCWPCTNLQYLAPNLHRVSRSHQISLLASVALQSKPCPPFCPCSTTSRSLSDWVPS